MQKNRIGTKGPAFLVYTALFSALTILFTRLIALPLGPYRITFGPVSTIMAGLWLGPVCGGITGFIADALGCFLQGYPPNPLILISSILWGVLPGLANRHPGLKKKQRIQMIAASVAMSGVIGSIGFTTAGLVLFMGYNFYAIFPGRLIQTIVMALLYIMICLMLYFSPLTTIVRGSVYSEPVGI